MDKQTGSKLGKEYIKDIYYLLIYLICRIRDMKCWAGWLTSWNQNCQEKYQQPQICKWYHFNGRKRRRTKEPLEEGERGEWSCCPKTHSRILYDPPPRVTEIKTKVKRWDWLNLKAFAEKETTTLRKWKEKANKR